MGEGANVPKVAHCHKNVPYARIAKTADLYINETGIPKQPFEHQLAEESDVHTFITICFWLFGFEGDLGPKQSQQPILVITEVWDSGYEHTAGFEDAV